MADTPRFTFRPLAVDDLPLFASWLRRPHVAAWWGSGASDEEIRREYEPELASSDVSRFYFACLDEVPVGFVQVYDVMRCDPEWWRDERDPGARGLFADDERVMKVQIDPSPDNARAIRAFAKAGFRPRR